MNEQQRAAIERALEALEGIRQYGLDTLSGRVDGPDDRAWQRAAVNEMTKRARLGITALTVALEQPAEIPEPPHCMVGGLIKDNAMCGHVIQMKFCGYGGPCQYKGENK